MRIRQLHYFMALAKYLSYKEAASALAIAQSVLSQQILELEGQLGTQLFVRDKRSLQLTAAGAELLKRLPELFALMDDTVSLAQNGDADITSESILRVGYERPFCDADVANCLLSFQQMRPDTRFLIRQYPFEGLTEALSEGKIDIAFFLLPAVCASKNLIFQVIDTDSLVLAIREEALVDAEPGDLKGVLNRLPLYCLEKSSGGTSTLLALCYSIGIAPELRFCEQMSEILYNIESGQGCAILPRRYLEMAICCDAVRLLELPSRQSRLCCAVAAREDNRSLAVLQFLGQLPALSMDCAAGCGGSARCYRHNS